MSYNQEIINFWKNDDFKNITAGAKQFPEGWDVRPFLRELIDGDIIEVGCGYGRLVEAFDPEKYLGVDINPSAIAEARTRNPNYKFMDFAVTDQLPESTWLMFYTVLLHVNDDDILPYLQSVTANTQKVMIAEIMDRERWRGVWKYAFNRSPEDYDNLLAQCGFVRSDIQNRPYTHYKDTDITFVSYKRK